MRTKGFYLSLTLLAAFSSVFVACGRKGGDDVRMVTKGNVALDGAGVASGATLEDRPYYLKVHRIYRQQNGYTTGMQPAVMGYTGCSPAPSSYQFAGSNIGTLVDIQVNGICKTFALTNSDIPQFDAELGIEISMTCDNAYVCDMVYLNIVGRNPGAYSQNLFNGNVTAYPGGTLGYNSGYTDQSQWRPQPNTQVRQVGVLKSIMQDRIMAAVAIQVPYNQVMKAAQVRDQLAQTANEYFGHQ